MAPARNSLPAALVVGLVLLCCGAAPAQDAEHKKSPYYKAIALSYRITSESRGDLDGDGAYEQAVAYRQAEEAVAVSGGVMVLSERAGGLRLVWHAFFKGFFPRQVSISGRTLRIDFSQVTDQGESNFESVLEYGKHIFFRTEKGSPFFGVKITASSNLKKNALLPESVFDGDLRTAWAEGAEGTGVGETLTFEFPRPVDLGLIGVLPGNVSSKKDWLENNRLHRADVTVETHADRFDTGTDVDLDRDLGLGLYGDIVEMEFANQPVLKYFTLEKTQVVSLEIKIRSVLLGEKHDDTYIAEVDFAEMFDRDHLEKLLRGEKDTAHPPAKVESSTVEKAPAASEGEDEGF
jgi:hypothetical protein